MDISEYMESLGVRRLDTDDSGLPFKWHQPNFHKVVNDNVTTISSSTSDESSCDQLKKIKTETAALSYIRGMRIIGTLHKLESAEADWSLNNCGTQCNMHNQFLSEECTTADPCEVVTDSETEGPGDFSEPIMNLDQNHNLMATKTPKEKLVEMSVQNEQRQHKPDDELDNSDGESTSTDNSDNIISQVFHIVNQPDTIGNDAFSSIPIKKEISDLEAKSTNYLEAVGITNGSTSDCSDDSLILEPLGNFEMEDTPMDCSANSQSNTDDDDVPDTRKVEVERLDCVKCGKVFRTAAGLKRHITVAHAGVKSHECSTCGKRFRRREELLFHVKIHKPFQKSRKGFASKGHPFHAKSKGKLPGNKVNAKTHACPVCEKRFGRRHHVQRHLKIHKDQDLHKAKNNGLTTEVASSERSVSTEVQTTNKNTTVLKKGKFIPKIHACTVCEKRFGSRAHLLRHLKTHKDKNIMSTKSWNDIFANEMTPSKLTVNPQVSTPKQSKFGLKKTPQIKVVGKTECPVCWNTFRSRTEMLKHMDCHKEKQSDDETLSNGNTVENKLDISQTGTERVKKHKCDICDKLFSDRYILKAHVNRHLGIRQFKCSLCSCAYTQPHHLKRHIQNKHKTKKQ